VKVVRIAAPGNADGFAILAHQTFFKKNPLACGRAAGRGLRTAIFNLGNGLDRNGDMRPMSGDSGKGRSPKASKVKLTHYRISAPLALDGPKRCVPSGFAAVTTYFAAAIELT
jgi:hypothetical protein